jgi:thiosulfate dehydrogenase [quinone] large subunit
MFLWPFADKVFGLGFATKSADAWINGVSPTTGFLMHGTYGPMASFFQGLVGFGFYGVNIVDWLFMLGLLFTGLTLLFNRFVVWGALSGSLIMLLIYMAAFPPEHNPILDDHLLQILALVLLGIRSQERH